MVKCKKHDIWLCPPVGCWKCHEQLNKNLKSNKPFAPAKGVKLPPLKR